MQIQEAAEAFESLINSNPPMGFAQVPEPELPGYVRLLVRVMLNSHGIRFSVGDTTVGDFYCLKLDDPYLQYLDIGPSSFMWCTEGHRDAVHPDEALVYLFKKYNNMDIKIMPDRTAIFERDGQKVYVPHPTR